MGFLHGGGQNTQITKYSGLQVQTTSSCVPIPIVYGQNILSPNCIWYGGFNGYPESGKGGKGGGSRTTSWDYRCAIIMGICEGPINAVGFVWTTSTTPVSLAALNLSLTLGTTPQTPWPFMVEYDPSQALGYPGVAYVTSPNYDLGTSASVGDNNFEVYGVLSGSGANHADADPAQVIYDFLTSSQYGVGFPAASIDATTLYQNGVDNSYQTYCWANYLAISPVLNTQESASSILDRWLKLTNSTAVWSGGKLKFLPFGDASATGGWATAQKTWTPNTTPLYALTDEDFLHAEGEDPVKVLRADPYSLPNQQSIEIQCRADSYNTGPVTAFDQSAINRFGLRTGPTITAHEICDVLVAQTAAQLILQRGLYIRKTFEFKLSAEFCLLEPMDLVTLTDPLLGLHGAVVRITEIEEAEDGSLSLVAEEFAQGVGSSVAYPIQAKSNSVPNAAVAPAAVNTPLIIEPPPALSGGSTQLWIGASGAGGDPNWGSCNVWASLDGTSYSQLATIDAPAKQGVLTAALPICTGANPDATDTLAVDLAQSAGSLESTSSASAAAGVTLCYVDGEYLSYTSATLTATSKYNLTGLYRGLDGIVASAHLSGASFCLLDKAILKYDVPTAEIGQTIYLKFQSVNIFGGGVEDISTCVAYAHTIAGTGVFGPVAATLAVGTAMDWGRVSGDAISETDDFGMASSVATTFIDLGNVTS